MIRFTTIIAIIALLSFSVYWLWQRQPKQIQSQAESTASATPQKPEEELKIESPLNNSAFESGTVVFKGKTLPNQYIVILAGQPVVIKTDEMGYFQKPVRIERGLSFPKVISLPQNIEKRLTLYSDPNVIYNGVLAGFFKSNFENILTIETITGDNIIRISKSAEFIFSKDNKKTKESTSSALDKIRPDDYIIGLGDKDGETLIAYQLIVTDDEIPSNNFEYFQTTITSDLDQDKFTAVNLKTQELIEFMATPETLVQSNSQENTNNISQGQNAIIITHMEKDKKIVDLFYITEENGPSQKP